MAFTVYVLFSSMPVPAHHEITVSPRRETWGGICNEPNGIYSFNNNCGGQSCSGMWHTFSVVIDRSHANKEEEIRFYVDGVRQYTVKESDVGDSATWANALYDGHYIILNLAMGGALPDKKNGMVATPTEATVDAVPMMVDYVSVWIN